MAKKELLWLVGCEGWFNVWVCAKDWPMATVAAADVWGASWVSVASKCYLVQKKTAIRNVCAKCASVFHGELPLCEKCKSVVETEKRIRQHRLTQYYKRGGA